MSHISSRPLCVKSSAIILLTIVVSTSMIVQDEQVGDFEDISLHPIAGGAMRRQLPFVREVEAVALHFQL
jgi:hypothetical protein